MNAQSIWVGQDYAWHPNGKRKGVPFQDGAVRIRAIGVIKEAQYGSARDTAFVQAYIIDAATGEIQLNPVNNEQRQRKVRARDISMRWEEYESELKHREEEEARRTEETRLAREVEIASRNKIFAGLINKGFNTERIELEYGRVKIPVHEMERWLGLSDS